MGVCCHALLQGIFLTQLSNQVSYITGQLFTFWVSRKPQPLTAAAAAAANSLQSCPTLCDPIDGSPPGSPVPGILQARTLEWVAISFSNARKWKVKGKSLSQVRLSATPWTEAYQAPPSMGFSRQEYWSGVPLLSPNRSLPVSKKVSYMFTASRWHSHCYMWRQWLRFLYKTLGLILIYLECDWFPLTALFK